MLTLELKQREYGKANKDTWELCFDEETSEFFVRHFTTHANGQFPLGRERYPVRIFKALVSDKLAEIGFTDQESIVSSSLQHDEVNNA
jgi:hypothetical protein